MAITPKKLQSWQIFHAARKHLGVERVICIFGKKNARSAYTWAQDPRFTEDRCRDPLEATHAMLSELDTVGRGDVARACLSYLATAVDGASFDLAAVASLKPTIDAEVLADYQALAAMQHAIEHGAELAEVGRLRHEAVDEINRTFAKFAGVHPEDVPE